MSKHVTTTKIKKEYTNAQGEKKTIEINYARVVDRIKEFRKDNQRGSIKTKMSIADGFVSYEAIIIKDKSDEYSADATGHAVESVERIGKNQKQFEKLETVAIGRALAILGYGASGEVASFEEMEEFTKYRDERIENIIEDMQKCKTIPDLRKLFMDLGPYMAESRVIKAKNKRKKELEDSVNGDKK